MQACLPVYCGGIGIIKAKSNASSAYIFSKLSCVKLEVFLLPDTLPLPPHLVILTMLSSTGKLAATLMCSNHLPISETGPWLYSKILSSHSSAQNVMLRMLLANSQKELGAWLEALPVPSLGLHLSDNELRIIVSLRHGVPTCTECICICNEKVGILGTHGLKCKKSKGRLSLHQAVNDIIARALNLAKIPAMLEPSGIIREDNKWPDRVTNVPWVSPASHAYAG